MNTQGQKEVAKNCINAAKANLKQAIFYINEQRVEQGLPITELEIQLQLILKDIEKRSKNI